MFLPRLSVSSDATLDPSDPFATPFVLHNDGYFSVRSVGIFCGIPKAEAAGSKMSGLGVTSPDLQNKEIAPDRPIEFLCPQLWKLPDPFTSAQLEIYVRFKASLFPQSMKCFRFTTTTDSNNNLRWFPDSADKGCMGIGSLMWYTPKRPVPSNYPPELR